MSDSVEGNVARDYASHASQQTRGNPGLTSSDLAPGVRARPKRVIAPPIEVLEHRIHHLRCPGCTDSRTWAAPSPQQFVNDSLDQRLLNVRWIRELDHLHLDASRHFNRRPPQHLHR